MPHYKSLYKINVIKVDYTFSSTRRASFFNGVSNPIRLDETDVGGVSFLYLVT